MRHAGRGSLDVSFENAGSHTIVAKTTGAAPDPGAADRQVEKVVKGDVYARSECGVRQQPRPTSR
jgi:hypothetical protein